MHALMVAVLMLAAAATAYAQAAPVPAGPVSEDGFLGVATYRLWEGDAPGAAGTSDADVPTLTLFRPHGRPPTARRW